MIIVNLVSSSRRRSASSAEQYYGPGMEHWRLTVRPHLWRPPTDMIETEDRYIVRAEIAGMNEADFSISMDQNLLTIAGVRPDPLGERRAYHQMEISYGEFLTQVELPGNIATGGVEAEYQDGFLRVTLPKAQPKQIRVNTD